MGAFGDGKAPAAGAFPLQGGKVVRFRDKTGLRGKTGGLDQELASLHRELGARQGQRRRDRVVSKLCCVLLLHILSFQVVFGLLEGRPCLTLLSLGHT